VAQVYWVRHGQADFKGDNYDKLTSTGVRQAELLKHYWLESEVKFDLAIVGTLERQRKTLAQLLSEGGPRCHVVETPWANEYPFHQLVEQYCEQCPSDPLIEKWTTSDQDQQLYYSLLRAALTHWQCNLLPNPVETADAFRDRVNNLINMVKQSSSKCVLVVSSGGVISHVLGQLFEMPPKTTLELNLQLNNSGVSHCYFNKSVMRVASVNNLSHLHPIRHKALITY
jgi:broad specificity phosphatase PhoE